MFGEGEGKVAFGYDLETPGLRVWRDRVTRTTAPLNRVQPFPISPRRRLTQEQADTARMILDTDPEANHREVAEFFGVPRPVITLLITHPNRYRNKT